VKFKDPCPYCHRKLTPQVRQLKIKIKSDNARNSLAKAKANGVKIGRKRTIDYDKAKALRMAGFSIRKIAKEMKCPASTVQRAIV
jgi:DNA invertase Pin-like site-specific DNA recombinase